jgi:plasmid maintenance system antidote protein VapI
MRGACYGLRIIKGYRDKDTESLANNRYRMSPEFWLSLQSNYDVAMLDYTGEKDRICQEARELATA